jgi:hypothetical protein
MRSPRRIPRSRLAPRFTTQDDAGTPCSASVPARKGVGASPGVESKLRKEESMYIGLGTVLAIVLIIVLIILIF